MFYSCFIHLLQGHALSLDLEPCSSNRRPYGSRACLLPGFAHVMFLRFRSHGLFDRHPHGAHEAADARMLCEGNHICSHTACSCPRKRHKKRRERKQRLSFQLQDGLRRASQKCDFDEYAQSENKTCVVCVFSISQLKRGHSHFRSCFVLKGKTSSFFKG